MSFHEGGWGMYPTLVFGVLMVGAAVRYLVSPHRRFVPLIVSLGVMTLAAGSLGFVTGVITSIHGTIGLPADQRYLVVLGFAESLNNVCLALALVVAATLAASVGAFRLSRMLPEIERTLS